MTKKKPVDPAIKRCIDAFYAAYVRRHNGVLAEGWLSEAAAGIPPADRTTPKSEMVLPMIKGAKDGALIEKMLATWGEARVLELIADFFGAGYMTFGVINSNQDIGALFAAAPRLLVRERTHLPSRRTASNLDAAARAMGRTSRPQPLALPSKNDVNNNGAK